MATTSIRSRRRGPVPSRSWGAAPTDLWPSLRQWVPERARPPTDLGAGCRCRVTRSAPSPGDDLALVSGSNRVHHIDVTTQDEDAWLRQRYGPEGGTSLAPDWKEWLHGVFVAHGPLPAPEVADLASQAKREGAIRACDLVTADVFVTLGESIQASSIINELGVRVLVNGRVTSGTGLLSIGTAPLTVEVADAIQEEIMDDRRAWPECAIHNSGLHPEVRDAAASWVFRVGNHAVAEIGQLGKRNRPTPRRRAKSKRSR